MSGNGRRLTVSQLDMLRLFVASGKERAETARMLSGSDDERAFYQRVVDQADSLLPLLSPGIALPDAGDEAEEPEGETRSDTPS